MDFHLPWNVILTPLASLPYREQLDRAELLREHFGAVGLDAEIAANRDDS
ncbi:hypothetical protein [Actinophytocola sp.]|nr:hypothetical protein [Actinophytocola sp.]